MATTSVPANSGHKYLPPVLPPDLGSPAGVEPKRDVMIWTLAQMRRITIGLLITGFVLGVIFSLVLAIGVAAIGG